MKYFIDRLNSTNLRMSTTQENLNRAEEKNCDVLMFAVPRVQNSTWFLVAKKIEDLINAHKDELFKPQPEARYINSGKRSMFTHPKQKRQ